MLVNMLANLTQLLPNSLKFQTMAHRSICRLESFFLHRKKENFVRTFLLNVLALDYDCRKFPETLTNDY